MMFWLISRRSEKSQIFSKSRVARFRYYLWATRVASASRLAKGDVMSNATCFEPRMLKDYLLGKLPDEQSDVISAHLEACLSCEATVAQLDRASDTLTDGLRLPIAGIVGETEPSAEKQSDVVLKQALSQMQSIDAPWSAAPQSRVGAARLCP